MLDLKYAINFRVAVYVRYSQLNKDLTDMEHILLQSGKSSVTRTLVRDKHLDSLIDTIRERHITFNRDLSGRVR